MDNETFRIKESYADGKFKLYAAGRIDANSSAALLETLENTLQSGKKEIILNMTDVKYLSSIGIRALLKTYKDAQAEGISFYIERPSDVVKNILGMAALKDMLLL